MSDETTQNFWTVIENFQWPEPEPAIYRLYHDEQGRPLFYSMELLPGTYIEVDHTTYVHASYQVCVKNGKLIVIEPRIQVSKMITDPDSGVPCDIRDVCVVVEIDKVHQKWRKVTNDIN